MSTSQEPLPAARSTLPYDPRADYQPRAGVLGSIGRRALGWFRELWELLGHADGLTAAPWPSFDPEVARAEEIVVPVQVNGKVRSRLTVPADASEEQLRQAALADGTVRTYTAGKTVRKVVVAGGKLVNVVVG